MDSSSHLCGPDPGLHSPSLFHEVLTMLTINRIAKVDSIVGSLLAALHRAVDRIGDKHETLIVNAAYKVAEAKAAAIGKTENKISNLEDARSELVAHGVEAKVLLQEKYKAALAALDKELAAKGDKLDTDLAAAAEALVTANKDYAATIRAVNEKLGVEVGA